ncbi:MAG: chlorophyll a/b-binding protein [Leptolyngbyaceae cyanobacterium]
MVDDTSSTPSPEKEAAASPLDDAPVETETPQAASFGWNVYAEKINGRFAMVGFVALLVLELFTHQDFFTWLGF